MYTRPLAIRQSKQSAVYLKGDRPQPYVPPDLGIVSLVDTLHLQQRLYNILQCACDLVHHVTMGGVTNCSVHQELIRDAITNTIAQ